MVFVQGQLSPDQVWEPHQSLHAIIGVNLCPQPGVSQVTEEHISGIPETFLELDGAKLLKKVHSLKMKLLE